MKIRQLLEGVEPKMPGAPKGISIMTPQQFVAKSEKGEEPEQGVAEGLESGAKILYTGKDAGGTVTISYEPDYIPGHSEKYIIRFDGKVKSEMPTLKSAVYGLTHYQFDTFRPNLQPNPKTVLQQGVAEGYSTMWEVSFDYGPHMSETVKVKAGSEEEAIAKVEKAAEKRGRSIMVNWAKPAEQGVAEEQLEETSPEAIAKIDQITRK